MDDEAGTTMSDGITQQRPFDERYGLVGVRDLGEYAEALTRLPERGRRERCASCFSLTTSRGVRWFRFSGGRARRCRRSAGEP
jgi:hypothetical protein